MVKLLDKDDVPVPSSRPVDSEHDVQPVAQALPFAMLRVRYPKGKGRITLRGDSHPYNWSVGKEPDFTKEDGELSVFQIPVEPGRTVEVKPMLDERTWAKGRNFVVGGGDECTVSPTFEREHGVVLPWTTVDIGKKQPLQVRVYLPPSYLEHDRTRYPVVYAQDGQALWSDQHDPFGIWRLDHVLDNLFAHGSMEEIIVVSIRTAEDRIERLSPSPDAAYGGGRAKSHLRAVVEHLKPWVDRTYRTLTDRDNTALLGSSMGGLFSFYGAWTRPDVFGKAICLSASFWWSDRWIIKLVQGGACPAPRPWMYLDSGVALNPFEDDVNQRDGQQHTQALVRALIAHCYARGDDLYVLSFPGQSHEPAAWSARVGIPLQLMFPRRA